jgi:hypothetical protein
LVTGRYIDIPFSLYFVHPEAERYRHRSAAILRKSIRPASCFAARRALANTAVYRSAYPNAPIVELLLQLFNPRSEAESPFDVDLFWNAIGATPIMLTILVVILLLVALGALPTWPYSRGWGYYPSSGLGLVFLVLVILLLMGRI